MTLERNPGRSGPAREFQNQLDRIDQIVSTEPWLVS